MTYEDTIRNSLGVDSIEQTDDALITRPAEVDLSGGGFTWEGETFRPGDWVIKHQRGWAEEFRWRPHRIGNVLAAGAARGGVEGS